MSARGEQLADDQILVFIISASGLDEIQRNLSFLEETKHSQSGSSSNFGVNFPMVIILEFANRVYSWPDPNLLEPQDLSPRAQKPSGFKDKGRLPPELF